MYKRVLIKLSGEALSGHGNAYDLDVLKDLSSQIKDIVDNGTQVGIVVGGGNICRGVIFEGLGLDRVECDYTGMIATVVNANMVASALNKAGVKAKAMSAIDCEFVEKFDKEKANQYLSQGYTLVFGGGVGKPYHSTDTGSAQRASDIKAEVIFMGKHGTDGVYDSDPNKNPNAKRFDTLTFTDIINKNLKVIDMQAAEVCIKENINAFVFNMEAPGNIAKAVKGESVGTLIRVKE